VSSGNDETKSGEKGRVKKETALQRVGTRMLRSGGGPYEKSIPLG